MKKGKGKSKGSAYEREIALRFSLWLSGNQQKDWFCRSVGSGSVATRNPDFGSQAGDISAAGSGGSLLVKVFLIECKRWKNLQLGLVLYSRSALRKAWFKAMEQAETHSKIPLLVAKADFRSDIVIVNKRGHAFFAHRCGLVTRAIFPVENMHLFLLNDLLNLSPAVFTTHLQQALVVLEG